MFEFFTTIFTKITTVIAGAIITIGIVSMPIEEPKQINTNNEQTVTTENVINTIENEQITNQKTRKASKKTPQTRE